MHSALASGAESSGSSGRCFPSDCWRRNVANKRRSACGLLLCTDSAEGPLVLSFFSKTKALNGSDAQTLLGLRLKTAPVYAARPGSHRTALGWVTSTRQPPNQNNGQIHRCDCATAVPSAINHDNTTVMRTAASRVPRTTPNFRIRKTKLLFTGPKRRERLF